MTSVVPTDTISTPLEEVSAGIGSSQKANNKDDDNDNDIIAKLQASAASKGASSGFFGTLVQILHPNACLKAFQGEGEVPLDEPLTEAFIDIFISTLGNDDESTRSIVLNELQRLVNDDHVYNRVPLVCSGKWNVFPTLVDLLRKPKNPKERLKACMIMNDISVPYDNKAVMALGEHSDSILSALLDIVRAKYAEAHFCCACLMNLSGIDDEKEFLLRFEPLESTQLTSENLALGNPLHNPLSLLRSVETYLVACMLPDPGITQNNNLIVTKGLAAQSAVAMLHNLTVSTDAAVLVANTQIPTVLATFVQNSPRLVCKWNRGSLEDGALSLLVELTSYPEARQAMMPQAEKLCECLEKVSSERGIYGMRAAAITCHLKETAVQHQAHP